MKAPLMSEAGMAEKLVERYRDDGWTIHQEVEARSCGTGTGRADIVATCGSRLVVIETKLALSFALLEQCCRWLPFASAVYAGVAKAKTSDGRETAFRCVGLLGLGALEVESRWPTDRRPDEAIVERVKPSWRSSFDPRLLRGLREEHTTHAKAGTNGGGYHTRFTQTVGALRKYAIENDGALLETALANSDHHYPSVRIGIKRLKGMDEKLATLGLRIGWATEPTVHGVEIGGDHG